MKEQYQILEVEKIDYDRENPRIKKALEKYGDKLDAERMHFALRSATDGSQNVSSHTSLSSYTSLKDSIRASGGVMTPITVTVKDSRYICIDGNTRLAIYKQFLKDGISGPWEHIKATVMEDATQHDIETIRISTHLVGPRAWPAYEKARYLHNLHNKKLMDYNKMIALCGGNRLDIERQIEAYHDMNKFYRDKVEDDAFHIDRFSGFVELQKKGIKEAIFETGFNLEDFGEWIRDGKIQSLVYVRQLPKVLRDSEAREIFLQGGPGSIEEAVKRIEQKQEENLDQEGKTINLEPASLHQLAITLTRRINDMAYSEVRALKNKESENTSEQVSALENLLTHLQILVEDVSE